MHPIAIINGGVRDWTGRRPDESAVLIAGECVIALGPDDRILERARAYPEVEVIDAGGGTIMPGLIDAHTHVEFCALSREWVDVRTLPREQTVRRVAAQVAGTRPGEWVIAQGTFGQDMPGRDELDAVSGDVPVLVRESMHRLSANSAALRAAGITRGFSSPRGALVEIDAHGEPTGMVSEGFHLFPVPDLSPEQLERALEYELRDSFARRGVTTVFELPASAGGVRAYQALNASGRLPVRLSLTLTVAPGLSAILSSIGQLGSIGLRRGFGGDRLWLNGVKLFLDGDDDASFDSRHLHLPPSRWGTVTRHHADLVAELLQAYEADLQVWIHAIGDLAQEVALDAIDEAQRIAGPGDRRTRLEHAANLQLSSRTVGRLQELEVIPVPTAGFIHADPGRGLYAYRSLLEAGLRPPGNSDTGGTQPFATNPWFGVAKMLDRTNRLGMRVAPEERVDFDAAVRTYTEFGAEAGFMEGRIGTLRPGSFGDCAIYAVDPATLSPAELETLEAEMTIVGGSVTWRRSGGDGQD